LSWRYGQVESEGSKCITLEYSSDDAALISLVMLVGGVLF
jgi:hypothetical protein